MRLALVFVILWAYARGSFFPWISKSRGNANSINPAPHKPATDKTNVTDIKFCEKYNLVQIEIGTKNKCPFCPKRQTFWVVADTTAADLWVYERGYHSECPLKCRKHNVYYPECSSSNYDVKKKFEQKYEKNTVSGKVVSDTVTIAGVAQNDQWFAAINKASSGICSYSYDGILGLDYGSISDAGMNPYFNNLMRNFGYKYFSFYFESKAHSEDCSEDRSAGQLIFDDIHKACYDGAFEVSGLITEDYADRYWRTNFYRVVLQDNDGNRIGVTPVNQTIHVVLNTASNLIYAPEKDARTINEKIGGKYDKEYNLWIVDCSKRDDYYPVVEFLFNQGSSLRLKIPSKHYIQEMTVGSQKKCFSVFTYDHDAPVPKIPNYSLGWPAFMGGCVLFDKYADQVAFFNVENSNITEPA